MEEFKRGVESIESKEMQDRYGAREGHSNKDADTKGAVLFGIPAFEEGGDGTNATHESSKDHVATSSLGLTVKAEMFGHQDTGCDQKGDSNVVQGCGE